MILDPDLTALVQRLNQLGCLEVELADDVLLKKRAEDEEREYVDSLTDSERERRVELFGEAPYVRDGIQSQVSATCKPDSLGDCLVAFAAYLTQREASELDARNRLLSNDEWASGGTFVGALFVNSRDVDRKDTFASWSGALAYQVSLDMEVHEPTRQLSARERLPPDASRWKRLRVWWAE